jgi:ubiquinone biosynthesis protein COQ9
MDSRRMTDAPADLDPRTVDRDRILDAALPGRRLRRLVRERAPRMAAERAGVGARSAAAVPPRRRRPRALFPRSRRPRLADALSLRPTLAPCGCATASPSPCAPGWSLVARDREAVRRGATLFALPLYAADGAQALWRTADTIWTGAWRRFGRCELVHQARDLSSVYSATVLYWLGDTSDGFEDTWAFLDRRIDGVMRFEKGQGGDQRQPARPLADDRAEHGGETDSPAEPHMTRCAGCV